ncbi:uncharacterized protein Z519_11048 [Cladophialophora bantiana CBS 173.52]|uniref:Ankyrin n=1 Tax=Cladophialophora bantiana (strain ATCC 10958 / CBS 173.52 / CDC B-1940 / NIH 8579) TaxID=1442370 RepID=A0A0D2HVC6_CLAB1|nr:uncharacterized protein Z519_11048 [Cladophialophora bantiana CBS 173.52]KIW88479.1 hypothetical protein Z519_11048 [Cladophialophora bantiana CBS 173.52]
MYAVAFEHAAVIEHLLTVSHIDGIDVNVIDDGFLGTALIRAVGNGHTAVVKLLSAWPGIDVNVKNEFGTTVLMYAAQMGQEAVVAQLLATAGIDATTRDDDGRTALMHAERYEHAAVVKLLRNFAQD